MSRKFAGFGIVVAMTAFLGLVSMPTVSQNDAEAGLLRRIFSSCGGGGGGGLQRYSSSCGGGGLQMYSSCSGGGGGLQYYSGYASCSGGGGGLQYAPVSYNYAPVQYQYAVPASGCPGGVCPPGSGGGLSYAPTYAPAYQMASVPVHLNPGEVYVAGSLREITPARPSGVVSAASKSETRPETRLSERKASGGKLGALPDGVVAYQLTQDDCHPCESDRQQARQQGVPLETLSFSVTEDAFKIAKLVRQIDTDVTGTPFYLIVKDGEVISYHSGDVTDFSSLVAEATKVNKEILTAQAQKAPEPEDSKIDRIEDAMLRMSENMIRMSEDVHAMRQSMLASAK